MAPQITAFQRKYVRQLSQEPFPGTKRLVLACISLLWYPTCVRFFPMCTPHGLRTWVPPLPASQALHEALGPHPGSSLEDAANKAHQTAVVCPGTRCAGPPYCRGGGARPGALPKPGTIIYWRVIFILKKAVILLPFPKSCYILRAILIILEAQEKMHIYLV